MIASDSSIDDAPNANAVNNDGYMQVYVIRVKGCLDAASFSDWFGDMQLAVDRERGETVLTGPVADQAELYGLLARLRGMALPLLSVSPADRDQTGEARNAATSQKGREAC
jgi:hypothetical protein